MTRVEMETRRLNGVALFKVGLSPREIARRLEVSATSAYRWRDQLEAGKNLRSTKGTGRPNRLTAEQRELLSQRFRDGATREELRWFIFDSWRIRYDYDHIHKLRAKLGIPAIHSKMGRRPAIQQARA